MSETELKFTVDPARAAALDAELRLKGGTLRSIRSRYFDTADRCLARAQLSLRLRKTAGAWEQTLKAPGSHPIEREEETVARPGRWGPGGPDIDPALHAGTRAGRLLERALGGAGTTDLLPVHETAIKRRAVDIEHAGARIELAFDRGTITSGRASTTLCELEYELKSGPPAALIALAKIDVPRHGLSLGTVSKAARADLLAQGLSAAPPVKACAPHVASQRDGAALFRAVVASCLDQVLGNAGEIATGHGDAEHVHQLRIGIRRLRTAARELAALAPDADRSWEAPLTDAFRALGQVRDRETVARAFEERLRAAGSPSPSIALSTSAPPDPAAVVTGAAFQCALLDAVALTLAPSTAAPAPIRSADARRLIGERLDRLQRRLKQGARQFEGLEEADQHRVRKRLKRLRYLAELVAPLYPARRVEAYRQRLEPAQDAVGAHVDLLLSRRAARAVAELEEPKAWFNVGWLGAEIAHSAKRARKALQRAERATVFW